MQEYLPSSMPIMMGLLVFMKNYIFVIVLGKSVFGKRIWGGHQENLIDYGIDISINIYICSIYGMILWYVQHSKLKELKKMKEARNHSELLPLLSSWSESPKGPEAFRIVRKTTNQSFVWQVLPPHPPRALLLLVTRDTEK